MMIVDSTADGRVVAHRARGASLFFSPAQAVLVISAFSKHGHWVMGTRDDVRPESLLIEAASQTGDVEYAHIGSSPDGFVEVLREGGIYLRFTPIAVFRLVEAFSAHTRWVSPRWQRSR